MWNTIEELTPGNLPAAGPTSAGLMDEKRVDPRMAR